MAGLVGIEPVMDELKTQLSMYLPAKITALQPTLNPILAMPAVAEYAFGERETFGTYPAISLVDEGSDITADNYKFVDWEHVVALWLFVTDPGEENLTRLVQRYTRCVLETLADRREAGAFSFGLRFPIGQRVEYTPRFSDGMDLFLGGSVIPVECRARDQR